MSFDTSAIEDINTQLQKKIDALVEPYIPEIIQAIKDELGNKCTMYYSMGGVWIEAVNDVTIESHEIDKFVRAIEPYFWAEAIFCNINLPSVIGHKEKNYNEKSS